MMAESMGKSFVPQWQKAWDESPCATMAESMDESPCAMVAQSIVRSFVLP